MRVGGLFIGALYHPSRPQYTTDSLLDYIEACVDELNSQYTAAPIVIAGDFNQYQITPLLKEQDCHRFYTNPLVDRTSSTVCLFHAQYSGRCELLHQSCAVIIRPL